MYYNLQWCESLFSCFFSGGEKGHNTLSEIIRISTQTKEEKQIKI